MTNVQNTVNFQQGLGKVGDIYDHSPTRVKTYNLVAGAGLTNAIGKAYTVDTTKDVTANLGGTAAFAGILINSNEHALYSGLNANQNVLTPQGGGALCSFGRVCISVPEAVTVGMWASYENANGTIHAIAANSVPAAGQTLIPGAVFQFFNAAANAVSVLELSGATLNITIEE
jgi:hypothetical protein